jgi:hypothetical protein
MRKTPSLMKMDQLRLFLPTSGGVNWEDLPPQTRAETARLLARLLVLRRNSGPVQAEQCGGIGDE